MQISKESIMKLGADKVGFADLRQTPSGKRDGMPFGISIAVALDPKIVNEIRNGPTVEYHYEYKRINDRLNDLAEKTAQCIKAKGFSAVAQTTTIVSTDKRNETNILPHKTVATLSGMGWIGKDALLITHEFGSAVRLTSVYTDMPLDTGGPIVLSQCGSCSKCVNACPAKAMTGKNWDRNKGRDYIYDAAKCRHEAKKQCAAIGIDNTICGICINICPYTQKYLKRGLRHHT